MPVICDNPDWWVIKIIDGFGPHTSSVEAMKIYAKHKILLVKEEGDTSHVCQAYDQKVAKDDKSTMRGCLAFLRKTTDLLLDAVSQAARQDVAGYGEALEALRLNHATCVAELLLRKVAHC